MVATLKTRLSSPRKLRWQLRQREMSRCLWLHPGTAGRGGTKPRYELWLEPGGRSESCRTPFSESSAPTYSQSRKGSSYTFSVASL